MQNKVRASIGGANEALISNDKSDSTTAYERIEHDNNVDLQKTLNLAVESKTISKNDSDLIEYSQGSMDWPEPKSIVEEIEPEPYPINCLPNTIRESVEEVTNFVQCPVEIAASSALGVLSAAAHGLANINRAEGLRGPINLYLLILADSGERKTTIDSLFSKPIKEWEQRKIEESIQVRKRFESDNLIWNAQMESLRDSLKKCRKNKNGDINSIENEIRTLMLLKPKKPVTPKILYTDCTPEALASILALEHHSGALISSEAGAILGGHGMNQESIMRNLSLLNILWEGGDFNSNRRAAENNFILRGARFTISVSIQPDTFLRFTEKSKGLVRGTGFMARFLFAFPKSTQGKRLFKKPPKWLLLNNFHKRISEILETPMIMNEQGELCPNDLFLSPDAEQQWISFHDRIELQLGIGGKYENVKDMASKTADNAARIAGLFHTYDGSQSDVIPVETIVNATLIAEWYLDEFKRFCDRMILPMKIQLAVELSDWLISKCLKDEKNIFEIRDIVIRGPNRLRKTQVARECAEYLVGLNIIFWLCSGKKTKFRINPKILPDASI